MKHLCFSTSFFLLTACALTCAHAQVRKAALPADTGVLSAGQPIVPHETPPKTDLQSSEKVFGDVEQQPEYPGGTKAMYKLLMPTFTFRQRQKRLVSREGFLQAFT
ncbi:hypothetical protein ACWKW6_10080 [Dyadobacter jiangsuensis]